jgi:chitinase
MLGGYRGIAIAAVMAACSAVVPVRPAGGGDKGDVGSSQWVLAYYVGYEINSYPVTEIEWTALTHIAFAPMTVKTDLTLDLGFNDSNGTGPEDAVALATAAHAHGVVPLLMLGGTDAGTTIASAATASNRAAFVAHLLSALDTLGFDGIDLDWEDHVNLDDFVALARELRAARPTIVLTYPAHTINANVDGVDPRMASLAESLDRFFVQTYFPSTAVVGSGWSSWFTAPLSGSAPTTPVAADDSLERYAAAGIPTRKLGLGAGFFAICYTGNVTGPRQPTTSTMQIVGGNNNYPLSALFASDGTYARAGSAERRRDEIAQEPYLSLATAQQDPHCGASTRYISYEDELSLLAKGDFSRTHGYGGIIIWTLAQGYLAANSADGRPRDAMMHALQQAFLE